MTDRSDQASAATRLVAFSIQTWHEIWPFLLGVGAFMLFFSGDRYSLGETVESVVLYGASASLALGVLGAVVALIRWWANRL